MKKKRVARADNPDPNKPINQEQFAELIHCSQQEVSKLVRYGVLGPDSSYNEWFIQYDRFLKGRIFERLGWEGLKQA